mmetsp:Transcript_15586/g.40310  ORF Transcript_15586/g.40310 Transcript_15586/m.40310 type:complete len:211 (-) Transcript_15586:208-840(-)
MDRLAVRAWHRQHRLEDEAVTNQELVCGDSHAPITQDACQRGGELRKPQAILRRKGCAVCEEDIRLGQGFSGRRLVGRAICVDGHYIGHCGPSDGISCECVQVSRCLDAQDLIPALHRGHTKKQTTSTRPEVCEACTWLICQLPYRVMIEYLCDRTQWHLTVYAMQINVCIGRISCHLESHGIACHLLILHFFKQVLCRSHHAVDRSRCG